MTPLNPIIRQLRAVFLISSIILITSLIASFSSISNLIESSKWVNHTYQVLIQAENVLSSTINAETSQRGYLITNDEEFMQNYRKGYTSGLTSINAVKNLTVDNLVQQKNVLDLKINYEKKFAEMQNVLDISYKRILSPEDRLEQRKQIMIGKDIMDRLRKTIEQIKAEEDRLLNIRTTELNKFVSYSPMLLLISALISIIITGFAYWRIKRNMDQQIATQKLAEEKYIETAERITVMENITTKIAEGDYNVRSEDAKNDELGRIAAALNSMAAALEKTFNDLKKTNWLQKGAVTINDALRGERNLNDLCSKLITSIADYLHVPIGTVYIKQNDVLYKLTGSYSAINSPLNFKEGEGVIGQAIKNKKIIILDQIPESYWAISSSLGSMYPTCIVAVPLIYEGEGIGVIEIGLLKHPEQIEIDLLESNAEAIAIAINTALNYIKLQNFLEETQAQAEELQSQHNELEGLNEELETQAQNLQASEEELKVQQEELLQTNTELEERAVLLRQKNIEIQEKARELALTTKYKSEFLANMSHELRTPLNSILLLSRLLADNNNKNLSDDEAEYAKVIQSSGNGLLELINEILDLSKIETGKMDLDVSTVNIKEVVGDLRSLFIEVTKEKKIELQLKIEDDVPKSIETDKMRLEQILKNLISNAIKFTSKGFVSFHVKKCTTKKDHICFIIKDSGIGIPKDKHDLIFEAFQQADGSTKRKYGGTGLGLSISRELSKLLQGEITLTSEENVGSEFTVSIPIELALLENAEENNLLEEAGDYEEKINPETDKYISPTIPGEIDDDRGNFKTGDKCILIIEDDVSFAKSLIDYTRKKGYKAISSVRGDEAISLAKKYNPNGILLDIRLPVKSGWDVMDELKQDKQTRHIPVHIMSSHSVKKESLLKGAVDFIDKPVAFEKMHEMFKKIEHVLTKDPKKVLIVEDNTKHAKALAYYLETFSIHSEVKDNVDESINALKSKDIDCIILDMGIPAKNAYEVLEEFKKDPDFENLPIIVFTGKSLSMAEEQRIKKYADSIIVKTAHSYQRMLDEVSLFLHVVEDGKKKSAVNSFKKLGTMDQILSGKTVLVTDDDVRNIFSLTKALETLNMKVISAINGKEALQQLESNPAIDIILLDMMMPEMDGYETAKRIRKKQQWKKIPVIAVTAKAMMGDREKCIDAGASDYISKPIDIDQLISLLRVWLYDKSI